MGRTTTLPASITTAAILLLLYGGLLLTCGVCSGTFTVGSLAVKNDDDPQQKKLDEIMAKEAPAADIVNYSNIVADLAVSFLMIGAGIGVLRLSPVARYIAYLAILIELLGACLIKIYQIAIALPAAEKLFAEAMKQQGGQRPPFDLGELMTKVGPPFYVMILIVQFVWLVTIAICLSTSGARAAFAGQLPAPPPDEPHDEDRWDDRDRDEGYGSPRPPRNPGDTGIKE